MITKRLGLIGFCALAAANVGCPRFSPNDPNNVDPNSDPNSGGGTNVLPGAWKGTLSCTTIQLLGDATSGPTSTESVPNFTITFDSAGKPTSITILGFVGVKDAEAQIKDVGDTQTINATSTVTSTTTAQIASALYTTSGATVVISITYHGTQGNLTQDGTADQTLTISINGDSMNYKNEVTYTVAQVSGTVNLQTGENKVCTGTLTRQSGTVVTTP